MPWTKAEALDSTPACYVAFTLNLCICSVLQVSGGRDCVCTVVSTAGVLLLDILIRNELFSPLKMQINHKLKVILLAMGSCRGKKKALLNDWSNSSHSWMLSFSTISFVCLQSISTDSGEYGRDNHITSTGHTSHIYISVCRVWDIRLSFDCNPAHFNQLLHCLPF